LHDNLSQKFAMLAVEAEILERDLPPGFPDVRARLCTLRDRIAGLSDDIRRIAYELHPSSVLEHLGLKGALRSLCAEFGKLNGIQVTFKERDVPSSIPPDVAFCLYRIAEESFHNVIKYAKPSEVGVTLTRKKRCLALAIVDHGTGLEVLRSGGDREGLGLVSMEERVKLVSGSLKLSSLRGKGMQIEALVPLPDDAQ
jgi:signal transduction histidine kinase